MENTIEHIPNLLDFVKYKEKDSFLFDDGTSTEKIHADFFEKVENNRIVSVGMFSHNSQTLFCAWGYKDEKHCSMHAVMGENNVWFFPQKGCPIKIAIKEGDKNIGLRMKTEDGYREFYFKDWFV